MGISQLEFLGIHLESISYTDTIAHGASVSDSVIPPVGQIYQLVNGFLTMVAPAGAASGTHKIEIFNATSASVGSGDSWIRAISAFGDNILIRGNVLTGSSSETPTDATDQYKIWELSWYSTDHPLLWKYTNDTDVDNTNNLTMNLLFKVYKGVDI